MPLDTTQVANLVEQLLVEQRHETAAHGDHQQTIVDHNEWLTPLEPKGVIAAFHMANWRLPERSAREMKNFLDPEAVPL